jgi:hypothetical protein
MYKEKYYLAYFLSPFFSFIFPSLFSAAVPNVRDRLIYSGGICGNGSRESRGIAGAFDG